MRIVLNNFYQFWRQVFLQFYHDGCFNRAGSLAYTTLLSLVPLLTVSFSFLTSFSGFKDLSREIQNFIFDNFITASAQTIHQHFQTFIAQTAHLSVWGLIFLLITAVLLIFSIEQAFNSVWHIKRRRNDISSFLIYWGVITFVPVLIGIALTVSSYLLTLPFILNTPVLIGIKKSVLLLIPYLLIYFSFTILYVVLPKRKVPFKNALIAAFFATILFEIAKQGFTFYISGFASYELIYGALAMVPISLIWLYIVWLIILFGAVISYVLTTARKYTERK
jgi:membrane protein